MRAFTTVHGVAAWLDRSDVDTDLIIRIERLTGGDLTGLGRYALEALRFRKDGGEEPDFVLNKPGYRGAPILIAGPNFGCGSSREPAVNALMALGVEAIIAPSFGDIFYANCFQVGLLPVRLPEAEVRRLGAEAAAAPADFTVDLEAQRVVAPSGACFAFDIDGRRRTMMLEGLDEIGLTLKEAAAIAGWQAGDRIARPWIWEPVAQDIETRTRS
ncbi:3-isopropylmalate dehydratase small subunit [Zavarzinia sp.]|uniref:3-isopropylmalate dehydratase small subunit n=1 Tax=Zavarzinia sp. TaxID=2027920 RepID=UPI003569AAD5